MPTSYPLPNFPALLYDYIETGNTTNSLTKRINTAIEKGRRNEIWRTEYMHFERMLMDARDEGREEERANTEREHTRAEKAEAEIQNLRAQLNEFKAQLPQ